MNTRYEDNLKDYFIKRFKKDAAIHLRENNSLKHYPVNEMLDFYQQDISRWVLVSEKSGLNEYLDNEYRPIIPSTIDHILLSALLKAFQLSSANDSLQKIAIKVPIQSYGFSLLSGFLYLIQHGLELNINELSINAKFKINSGVLLISDNNDLGIRLLGTRYGNQSLTEIYPTYKLKNSGEFQKWCNVQPINPTLPWFSFFRAYFDTLPEKCDLSPHITIIDTMPMKHRDKLDKLIRWAEEVAKTKLVLVISPLGNNDINKTLEKYNLNIISTDNYFVREVTEGFIINKRKKIFDKTRCWSVSDKDNTSKCFSISLIKGCNEIENLVTRIIQLIDSAEDKYEGLPRPFQRLKAITFDLLNMVIPLYWFERERELQKKPTLLSLIERATNAVPLTEHERRVYNNTLPAAKHEILSLYTMLENLENTPKGLCLIRDISELAQNTKRKLLILVGDNVTKTILPQWIRQMLDKHNDLVTDIEIYTLNEYHRLIISEAVLDVEDRLIMHFGWWQRKYYDLLWDERNHEISFIVYEMEADIVRKQIKVQNSITEKAHYDRIRALNHIYSVHEEAEAYRIEKGYLPELNITERLFNSSIPQTVIKQEKEKEIPLDIDILINLMQKSFEKHSAEDGIEQFEESLENSSLEDQIQYYGNTVQSTNFRCLNVTVNEANIIFLEKYSDYKVFNANNQKLDDIPAIQIYPGNYLVRLRSGERKDIFNYLLESVSKTPVMLYINSRLNQWSEMIHRLKEKHANDISRNVGIYESMLIDLRSHGCNIKRHETIRNWVRGWTKIIDHRNLIAVASALGDKESLSTCEHINIAMRKLFGIHIELGKALSKVLYKHVTKAVDGEIIESAEIVEIQGGIKLPLSDIVDAVEILKIEAIDKNTDYSVPYWLLGKVINKIQYDKLIEQNIIKKVKE